MISEENTIYLKKLCKYKEKEISLLSCLIQPQIELMMPAVLIEGTPSSGKTHTLINYLEILNRDHQIDYINIECDFCFTQREILRKIHKSLMVNFNLAFTSAEKEIITFDGLPTFPNSLKQINKYYKKINNKMNYKPMIIVLDRIDKLPRYENPGELIRCLSKLHEQSTDELSNFCFIAVVTRCDFLDIGTSSIPTIKFNSYKLDEFKNIIHLKYNTEFWAIVDIWKKKYENEKENEEDLDDNEYDENEPNNEKSSIMRFNQKLEISTAEKSIFFKQFIDMIMNTYSSYVGLSLDVVTPILRRIWPIFIDPIIKKGKIIKGVTDAFTTFMKNKRMLGKEIAVVTKLENSDISLLDIKREDFNDRKNEKNNKVNSKNNEDDDKKGHYDLSVKTKYLVIAAFLASYNERKYDIQFFSKSNQYSKTNSIIKHRQKKIKTSDKGEGKLRRDMSAALPFSLERLLAILNAIWAENIGDDELLDDVELMSEIATLSSLKTLIKMKNGDTIGGQTKWKCNVHWNVVKKFASDVGFAIENHLQD